MLIKFLQKASVIYYDNLVKMRVSKPPILEIYKGCGHGRKNEKGEGSTGRKNWAAVPPTLEVSLWTGWIWRVFKSSVFLGGEWEQQFHDHCQQARQPEIKPQHPSPLPLLWPHCHFSLFVVTFYHCCPSYLSLLLDRIPLQVFSQSSKLPFLSFSYPINPQAFQDLKAK